MDLDTHGYAVPSQEQPGYREAGYERQAMVAPSDLERDLNTLRDCVLLNYSRRAVLDLLDDMLRKAERASYDRAAQARVENSHAA